MAELIWSIIGVLGAILLIVVILWSLATGRGDRDREEAAREFYDEHGHWPDEPPMAALQRGHSTSHGRPASPQRESNSRYEVENLAC